MPLLTLMLAGAQVSMAVVPHRVCVDPRSGYASFDLQLASSADKELAVTELRALVFASDGTLVERKLVWQDALRATRPDAAVPANGKAVIFNPIHLTRATPGRRVRVEADFAGAPAATAEFTPADCTAGQPRLILPVAGRVLVCDGYDALSHHRRSDYLGKNDPIGTERNFQRYGMDLVVVDRAGKLWTGDGKRTADWLGWGVPVRAAAAGRVTHAHDGQADNVVIGTIDRWGGPRPGDPMSPYGNYVLIDHGNGEFTVYGHLRQGSVKVRPGDRVASGQAIGGMGNSGASGGVHLHWERRRGTGYGLKGIETQPVRVSGVTLAGGSAGKGPVPIDTGDILIAR
ncbi:murein hydrolase activator EnvC family protein [Sphingomonas koreensis]